MNYINQYLERYKKLFEESNTPKCYKKLSIIPEPGELKRRLDENKLNKIKKGRYSSPYEYLETHFRLIREDIINPFRNALQSFNKGEIGPDLYTNVRVRGLTTSGFKIGYEFTFDYHYNIDWETFPKLLNGSLVALSCDNFQTVYYMIVSEREERGGHKKVGLSPYQQTSGDMNAATGIDPLKFNKEFFDNIYVMIESPSFFISYENILLSLQRIDEDNLPFKDTLVYCNRKETETPPQYIKDNPIFNFEKVFGFDDIELANSKGDPSQVDILKEGFPKQLGELDQSQMQAVEQTLGSSLSLIQGPPGTGKSFIGKKLFHIIHNKLKEDSSRSDSSPILVLSHTNHALDQFTSGLLPITKNIIRVGTRSKDPALKDYTMKAKIKNGKQSLQGYKKIAEITLQLRDQLKSLVEPFGFEDLKLVTTDEEDYESAFLEERQYVLWTNPIRGEIEKIKKELKEENRFENAPSHQFNKFKRPEKRVVRLQEQQDQQPEQQEEIFIDECFEKSTFRKKKEMKTFESRGGGGGGGGGMHRNKKNQPKKYFNEIGNCLKFLEYNDVPMRSERKKNLKRINQLNENEKIKLYRYWCKIKVEKCLEKTEKLFEEFHIQSLNIKKAVADDQRELLQNAEVISATITGASRMKQLFESLKIKVLIIEECALTLEGQITACLPASVQHCILIGDHKQLKPICTDHTLLTKFNLNISIFERIVENKGRCSTLATQRRMVPSISQFVVPVYPNLKNHSSVIEKERINSADGYRSIIRGVLYNVYFFDHSNRESRAQEPHINSKSNNFEAKLIISFANYLLDQNYEPERITILAPYAGQLLEIQSAIHSFLKDKQVPFGNGQHPLENILIRTVDQYQGEENDIIIISSVRNNERNVAGFLSLTNRINVMLSRAREGLFIFGNRELLERSKEEAGIWKNMFPKLEENNQVGKTLPLVCENHRKGITHIRDEKDFIQYAKDGGCKKPCSFLLDCGHTCSKKCHPLQTNHNFTCSKPCLKPLDCGHLCQLKCCENCRCEVDVDKTHPRCRHSVKTPCYRQLNNFDRCPEPCSKLNDQGLRCLKKCSDVCEFKPYQTIQSNSNPMGQYYHKQSDYHYRQQPQQQPQQSEYHYKQQPPEYYQQHPEFFKQQLQQLSLQHDQQLEQELLQQPQNYPSYPQPQYKPKPKPGSRINNNNNNNNNNKNNNNKYNNSNNRGGSNYNKNKNKNNNNNNRNNNLDSYGFSNDGFFSNYTEPISQFHNSTDDLEIQVVDSSSLGTGFQYVPGGGSSSNNNVNKKNNNRFK